MDAAPRKIRICQLITELRPAGAERCVFELARRLDPARFDVRVAALRGGEVADWLAAAGVPMRVLDVRGKWDLFKLAGLVRWLRVERIDLLHTHLFHADLAGRIAAAAAGVPHLVHTVHVAEKRFRPWRFAWARLGARRCERIVCVSESVRRQHARRTGLAAERYTVIPNGIDTDAYARNESARVRLRREWGVGDDEVLPAFVGRLDVQKGLDVLLAALELLAARGKAARVVFAGRGPQRLLLEQFLHTPAGARCRDLGFVHDVPAVLSAADVLVMPSRWEGWPLAAGEALAAGLPVIATRVDGLRDVVDETVGLLVPPDDPTALADAIERLCADGALRAALGQAGRRRATQQFAIRAFVEAHERLYEQIAGAIPPGCGDGISREAN